MGEVWKPISGYEGAYEVSSLGRVQSLDRITDRGRRWKGRLMTPSSMPSGYRVVTLWKDGKQKVALVHRLVLFAFVGQPQEGEEVLHIDGSPDNNELSNLRWGSHSENELDKIDHGTHVNASKDFCPSGHPYDSENTYWYPGKPHRACRKCRRENLRRWKSENPERATEIARRADIRFRNKKKGLVH